MRHAGSGYQRFRQGAYGRPIRVSAPVKCFAVRELADKGQRVSRPCNGLRIELTDCIHAELTLFIDI